MQLEPLNPEIPTDAVHWDEFATDIWQRDIVPLIDMGFLKSIDRQGVIDYCLLAAIPSPDRSGAQNTAIHKYISSFGLSPESRAKLKSLLPTEPKKSLADFLEAE